VILDTSFGWVICSRCISLLRHKHEQKLKQGEMSRRKNGFSLVVSLLVACCFFTLSLNLLQVSFFYVAIDHEQSFRAKHIKSAASNFNPDVPRQIPGENRKQKLAGLSCGRFGGPEDPSEMVYWSDIPEDSSFVSPFKPADSVVQYLLFEPDDGGWNNIRMSMETVMAMAHAMGRTLVLPPEQAMYLLGASQQNQKNTFSFMDFFPMDAIASENRGLDIITMDDFLEKEGITGHLKNFLTGMVSFPPQNRTNWNGINSAVNNDLNPWIRSIAMMPEWDPDKCLAAFPKSRDPKEIEVLSNLLRLALDDGTTAPEPKIFVGHPTKVDALPRERLREALAGRNKLCIYDEEMQNAPVIHFHGKKGMGARLLVHFYAFLFFEDWRQDVWIKRFVRDHVRYVDEIQCAAARIVQGIREQAATNDNPNGDFDTFHIRRGDFQYKKTRISAEKIYEISKDTLTEGSTVYLATDERDKSFFAPLLKKYRVLFLDDLVHLIPGVNTNYYGMIDQLVASRGRFFFGCWFSTFTGYINRIRGYVVEKYKLPGHEDGVIQSYYYALAEHKLKMREYYPVKKSFYAREFPASWRDIDVDVGAANPQVLNNFV
jgi:GDP-fucose protein O-fucosyltransferase